MFKLSNPNRLHRLQVLLRILAAVVVGYIFSASLGILLAYALPSPQSMAVLTSTLLSFIIYLLVIMAVFAVDSLKKIAWFLVAPTLLMVVAIVLLQTKAGVL